MQSINKIKELLQIKKQNVSSPEDLKKIKVIDELLLDETIFFKIKYTTAIGILKFLNVPENEISELYKNLISPDKYFNSFPKTRISLNIK